MEDWKWVHENNYIWKILETASEIPWCYSTFVWINLVSFCLLFGVYIKSSCSEPQVSLIQAWDNPHCESTWDEQGSLIRLRNPNFLAMHAWSCDHVICIILNRSGYSNSKCRFWIPVIIAVWVILCLYIFMHYQNHQLTVRHLGGQASLSSGTRVVCITRLTSMYALICIITVPVVLIWVLVRRYNKYNIKRLISSDFLIVKLILISRSKSYVIKESRFLLLSTS